MSFVDLGIFKKEPRWKMQQFNLYDPYTIYARKLADALPGQQAETEAAYSVANQRFGAMDADTQKSYKSALDFLGQMAPGGLYNSQTNAGISRAGALAKQSYQGELAKQTANQRARLSGAGFSPFGDSSYARRALSVPTAEFNAKQDYNTAAQQLANDQNFLWRYNPSQGMNLAQQNMQFGMTPLQLMSMQRNQIYGDAANVGNILRGATERQFYAHTPKTGADYAEFGANTIGSILGGIGGMGGK